MLLPLAYKYPLEEFDANKAADHLIAVELNRRHSFACEIRLLQKVSRSRRRVSRGRALRPPPPRGSLVREHDFSKMLLSEGVKCHILRFDEYDSHSEVGTSFLPLFLRLIADGIMVRTRLVAKWPVDAYAGLAAWWHHRLRIHARCT